MPRVPGRSSSTCVVGYPPALRPTPDGPARPDGCGEPCRFTRTAPCPQWAWLGWLLLPGWACCGAAVLPVWLPPHSTSTTVHAGALLLSAACCGVHWRARRLAVWRGAGFCWRRALWLSRPVFPRLLRSVPPAVSYRALSLTLAASSRLAGRPTGLFSRRRACRWGWEATPAPVVWRRLPYRFPDSLSQRPSPILSDCGLFAGDCRSGDGTIEGYPPPASLAATAY